MAHLVQIGIDNPFRLEDDIHYFQYNTVRFKFVQLDPRQCSDVLLSLAPDYSDDEVQRVYGAAGEWVSAWSWQMKVGMTVRPIGGMGVPDDFPLKKADAKVKVFPLLPFKGYHVGHTMARIAQIESAEQRKALALYRDARSANNVLLSLLLFWQILELRGQSAVAWSNRMMEEQPGRLHKLSELAERIDMGRKSLGDYLLDDCRHAIAHITRDRGRREIQFDNHEEDVRLRTSSRISELLARHYIDEELGVTESLYLVRPRGGGFPTYRSSEQLREGIFTEVD